MCNDGCSISQCPWYYNEIGLDMGIGKCVMMGVVLVKVHGTTMR